MPKKIKIRDLTLRDGQHTLVASRMSTESIEKLLPLYRRAGFHIMEVWGGDIPATAMSALDEDPWHRLRVCADAMRGTSLIAAVSRGRNLFGDSPYPNFVLESFYKEAIRNGLDVMRIYDALNDTGNMRDCVQMITAAGGIADAAVCYAVDPGQEEAGPQVSKKKKGFFARLFGSANEEKVEIKETFTDDYFVAKAKELEALGAKIITLKDTGGLISPSRVFRLMPKLKHAVRADVGFHTRCGLGNGLASMLTAIIKGVDIIDTNIWWFAGGQAAPPIELVKVFCDKLEIEIDADMEGVAAIRRELAEIRRELADFDDLRDAWPKDFDEAIEAMPRNIDAEFDRAIDAASDNREDDLLDACHKIEEYFGFQAPQSALREAGVPREMYVGMTATLDAIGTPDAIGEAMELVPKVRRDAGFSPLVNPTAGIIGSQAALLALDRRTGNPDYTHTDDLFVRLIRGEFGSTPNAVAAEFRNFITGSAEETSFDTASYKDPANPSLEEFGGLKLAESEDEFILLEIMPEEARDFLLRRRKKEYDASAR